MKSKEIFTFVLIAFFAAIFSYVISNAIFNSSERRTEKVPVVEPISSEFPAVGSSTEYKNIYNSNALDPTQLIKIGTSQNKTPFNER